MGKYISAEKFKEKYLCFGYIEEMSEEKFDKFPGEDVVPVVRCKDCVYMKEGHCEQEDVNQRSEACWVDVESDWYCCHGVRRTD